MELFRYGMLLVLMWKIGYSCNLFITDYEDCLTSGDSAAICFSLCSETNSAQGTFLSEQKILPENVL